MKKLFLFSSLFLSLFLFVSAAFAGETAIELFDGESLFGWTSTDKQSWSVSGAAGSAILVGKGPAILRTTSQFGEYDLAITYRMPKKGVASLLLRTDPNGKRCAEFPLTAAAKSEEWSTLVVSSKTINQKTKLGRGYIGVRLGVGGQIEIKKLSLIPVGLKPLYNGADLTGWRKQGEVAVAPIAEGVLELKGGNGSLETTESFGDFDFQAEVFVNGDNLNSGIFFRSIPNDKMNGYECQINNSMKSNDPYQPADCGTGGIFRRVDARKIVAKDRDWFRIHINATGAHFAVWVNGFQVTDWTDTRKENENPRRGLRKEPGTIQLQGHDATTDMKFRNLSAGTIEER